MQLAQTVATVSFAIALYYSVTCPCRPFGACHLRSLVAAGLTGVGAVVAANAGA